jgi:hypothetical protein
MGSSGDQKTKLKKIKTINTEVKNGQFNNKICEIKKGDVSGLGFFCKIESPNSKDITPVLITSYDLIGYSEILTKKIEFTLNNKTYNLNFDDSRKYYFDEELYNTTIIEIKKEDNLDIDSFFEIEMDNNKKDIDYLARQTIVLLYKNIGNNLDIYKISPILMNKNGYQFKYKFDINSKCYGNPLLNITNNKIIAIHQMNSNIEKSVNIAILLRNIINEFNAQNKKIGGDYKLDDNKKKTLKESIKISAIKTIKTIKSKEMKNEVILTYLIPDEYEEIKIFGERFVKNNKDKCYFLIQNEKTQQFEEYDIGCYFAIKSIPNYNESMQVFRIILIQTDDMFDLTDMFFNCGYLLDVIDIHKLYTENVKSMTCMFDGCTLLSGISNLNE